MTVCVIEAVKLTGNILLPRLFDQLTGKPANQLTSQRGVRSRRYKSRNRDVPATCRLSLVSPLPSIPHFNSKKLPFGIEIPAVSSDRLLWCNLRWRKYEREELWSSQNPMPA